MLKKLTQVTYILSITHLTTLTILAVLAVVQCFSKMGKGCNACYTLSAIMPWVLFGWMVLWICLTSNDKLNRHRVAQVDSIEYVHIFRQRQLCQSTNQVAEYAALSIHYSLKTITKSKQQIII